jgi:PAS domain S-box-containing protein
MGFIAAKASTEVEHKLTEEALHKSEERYRSLVETSQDLIWMCDAEGRFTYLNKAWEGSHGYKTDEMLGRKFTEFQTKETADRDIKEFSRHLAGGSVKGYETTHISKSGDTIHLVFNAIPLFDENENIRGTQGTAFNLTEMKKAEVAVRESAERWQTTFDSIKDTIAIMDSGGRIVKCNKSMEQLLGKSMDEIINSNCCELIPCVADKDKKCPLDLTFISKNRENSLIKMKDRWFHVMVDPILDENGNVNGAVHIMEDITESKHAEESLLESEEKFREITDLLPQTVFEVDINGKFIYSNQFGFESTGYTHDDMDREIVKQNISEIMAGKLSSPNEYKILRKDGTSYPVLIYSRRIIRDNKPVGFRGIVIDITERKKTEENLKRSLKERDLLFKELKHRVKNNLQLLSSMLELQVMRSENENIQKTFQEIQSVIETMALIYSRAYEEIGIVSLNLDSLIEELVNGLIKFRSNDLIQIDYPTPERNISLNTDQAIPFILITNELVFNALKHAFKDREKGLITVLLNDDGKNIILKIKDNGVGFPQETDVQKPKSLGLRIVRNLVEQLQGKLDAVCADGTEFILKVPKERVL